MNSNVCALSSVYRLKSYWLSIICLDLSALILLNRFTSLLTPPPWMMLVCFLKSRVDTIFLPWFWSLWLICHKRNYWLLFNFSQISLVWISLRCCLLPLLALKKDENSFKPLMFMHQPAVSLKIVFFLFYMNPIFDAVFKPSRLAERE